jgi:hypothetical protein
MNPIRVSAVFLLLGACAPSTPCKSTAECASGSYCSNGSCVMGACTAETEAETCSRLSLNCDTTAQNNCGTDVAVKCGTCGGGQSCTAGKCGACVPEAEGALCTRLGKDCGTTSLTDNCGALRTVTCGTCTAPKLCGGGGTNNVCGGCKPETDGELCSAAQKNCGAYSAMDRCGNMRTAICGTCTQPNQICGGGLSANVCGCTAENRGPTWPPWWPAAC